MIRKCISFALIACLFIACFFLPDAIARLSDWRIKTDPVYTIFCPEKEFSYIGTLEDRLRALTGYENMSVDYKMTLKTEWQTIKSLPEGISALIPDLGQGEIRERSITLGHKTVPVNFQYTETELHTPNGSARIVTDPETDKILRISLTNAREAIRSWENTRNYDVEGFFSVTGVDAYALLREYARLNGFSEITDLTDGNSYGGSILTVKADVREHPYSLSLTFSENAGTVYYRLIQVEGK
ncbi:MAG: hypothetical protein IJN21_05625 [Clostridia bacterium]|nr:hypothetical protein [Clostridia bacterium]